MMLDNLTKIASETLAIRKLSIDKKKKQFILMPAKLKGVYYLSVSDTFDYRLIFNSMGLFNLQVHYISNFQLAV